MNKSKKRQEIQILRGIAVIAVILFHLEPEIFKNGYLGVDVFFVISGFVIAPMIIEIFESEKKLLKVFNNLKLFYLKRLYRLLPAASVTIFVSILFLTILTPFADLQRSLNQALASLFFAGNFGALRYNGGGYFNTHMNPFVHFWSLGVEAQIYFLIPIILIFTVKIIGKKSNFYLIVFFLAISILSLFIDKQIENYFTIEDAFNFHFYSPFSRVWEFCFGAIVFLLNRNKSLKINKYLFYILFSFLILFLFLNISSPLNILLINFLTSLCLIFPKNINYKNLLSRYMIKLGDISYSLYLVHLPILYLFKFSPYLISINAGIRSLISLGFILFFANLQYKSVEVRFRNISSLSMKKTLVYFLFIPVLFLLVDRYLVSNSYFLLPPVTFSSASTDCNIENTCRYGSKDSSLKLVLIGDSHAQAAAQEIIFLAEEKDVNLTTFFLRGCQFVLDKNVVDDKCLRHNRNIIKFLRYSPIQEQRILVVQASTNFSPASGYIESQIKGIEILKKLREDVTVIGPIPEFRKGFDLTLQNLIQKNLSLSPARMDAQSFVDDHTFKQKLHTSNIRYFSSIDVFCKKSKCTIIKEGERLYWDTSHLSNFGARYLFSRLGVEVFN